MRVRYTFLSLCRPPSCVGIAPVSWFLFRCRPLRFVSLPSRVGIDPVSAFPSSHRYCRPLRLPSADGIDPVKPMPLGSGVGPLRCRVVSELPIDTSSGGIVPVNRFPPSTSHDNCVSWPSSGGIVPVSWFHDSFSCRSADNSPRPAGMLPVRLLLWRFSSVTRCGVPLTVTPVQLARAQPKRRHSSSTTIPQSAPGDMADGPTGKQATG